MVAATPDSRTINKLQWNPALRPPRLSFKPNVTTIESFYYFEDPPRNYDQDFMAQRWSH